MREAFQGQMTALGAELIGMSRLVTEAVCRATRALADADLELAEAVITGDAEIDLRGRRCEEHACALLALQAPVAGDLRAVVTAIRVAEKVERMGDLVRHVAELARRRHPRPVLPPELMERVVLMGELAAESSRQVERTLASPTGDRLPALELADDEIDRLQDEVLDRVRRAEPAYPVEVAVDIALLARYLERFADQAVGVVKHLDYAVTGRLSAGAP
jgi:phosphate transport system protein